jgi:hypothetical protein
MTEPAPHRLPDFRGWAAIGFFAVTFMSLHMIDKNPALLGIPSFMQFIGGLATGGVLLVASHLFGGTKSGAETNAKLAESIGVAPAPGTVTVSPPSTITVDSTERTTP